MLAKNKGYTLQGALLFAVIITFLGLYFLINFDSNILLSVHKDSKNSSEDSILENISPTDYDSNEDTNIEKPKSIEDSGNTTKESVFKITNAQPSIAPPLTIADSTKNLYVKTGVTSSPLQLQQKPEEILPPLSPSELNLRYRKAIVNILCTTKKGGLFKPSSGTGILIDPRGVIITNAHIAQMFLLSEGGDLGLECIVRTGSPAINTFEAKLLYISQVWIRDNTDTLVKERAQGSGENDFGLLLISNNMTKKDSEGLIDLVAVEIETETARIESGDSVLLSAYPADFLSGISIQKNLFITSTIAKIANLITFSSTNPQLDAITIEGNILAQHGASGGAVASLYSGSLIGIITARTEAETTDERELRAITISHISRSLEEETGYALEEFLNSDLEDAQRQFVENIAPDLRRVILDASP